MRATLTALEIQLTETLVIVEAELTPANVPGLRAPSSAIACIEVPAMSCASNDVATGASHSAGPETTQHVSLTGDLNVSLVMDATPPESDDLSLTDDLNASSITDATPAECLDALVQLTESAVSTADDIEQVKSEAITPEHIAGVNKIEPPALLAEQPATFLAEVLADQEPSSPLQSPVEECAGTGKGPTDHENTAAAYCSKEVTFDAPPENEEPMAALDAEAPSGVMPTALGLKVEAASKHEQSNVVCVTNYENTAALPLMAFDVPPEDDKPVTGANAEAQPSGQMVAICLKAEAPSKHQEANVVQLPGKRQWSFKGIAASVAACLTLLAGLVVLSNPSELAALSRLGGVTSAR